MLTSIRGLSAATLSAGLLLSAAPAFAEEAEATPVASEAIAAAVADGTISSEIIAASATLDVLADSEGQPFLTTGLNPDTTVSKALAPIDTDETESIGGDSGVSLSANVALTTDYRFRGVSLSGGNLAIQGGFDIGLPAGFYVGTWASNLDEDTVGYGSIEWDLYGGWSGDLTEGLSADVGFIAYLYPDAGPGEFDYYEFYGSLSGSFGPASLTGGVAYAYGQEGLDFGGGQDDNLYLYVDASVGIPETPFTLNGHIGYTDGVLTFTNDSDAIDWSVSADASYEQFTFSVAYIGVERDVVNDPTGVLTDDTIVATISASF